MDLTVKDVAELLHVSRATIHRWLMQGKIPAYRWKNRQFRFNRTEIEAWMVQGGIAKENVSFSSKTEKVTDKVSLKETQKILAHSMGTQTYSLFRAIHKGGVLYDIPGSTKEEVIRYAVERMAPTLNVDADVLSELLLDRENLMPTSLDQGVAVPHTRDFLLSKPFDAVTVVYPQKPIDYGALDGKKVEVLFFLFACQDKRHLHLLAKIAHLTGDKESLLLIKSRPEKAVLLGHIKSWEAKILLPNSK